MKKSLKDFKKEDYYFIGRWKCPTLAFEPWVCMKSLDELNSLGIKFSNKQFPLDGYSFSLKEPTQQVKEFLDDSIKSGNYNKVRLLTQIAEIESSKFIEFGEEIITNEKTNIKKKLELFNLFLEKYSELSSIWDVSIIVGDLIQSHIEKESKNNKLNPSDVLNYVSITGKTKHSEKDEAVKVLRSKLSKSRIEFRNPQDYIKIKKENKILFEEINELLNEYAWIGTHHFWGEQYNLDKLIYDINKNDKNQLKQKIDLPDAVNNLLLIAGDMAWIRMHCAEAADMVSYWIRPLIGDLANKIGLIYDEIIWLNKTEINTFIKESKMADKNIIEERMNKVGCYFDGEKMAVVQGNKLEEAIGLWVGNIDKKVLEMRGQPACRGIVKGRARIVITPNDAELFEQGEILVAPETTPDLFHSMKKSSAIVTDRGGLTSHAAIVARELNKPCVVGVKNATEIIRMGDEIEVDANKGIVKILKRKSDK